MGSLLSNLGVIAEYQGDYAGSRAFHERALALRTDIGDRWAIAVSMTNLGMIAVLQKRFDEARDWFQRSMLLNREVGDTWMVAICHNNLGNATRGLGEFDEAREHYADSLRAYRDYDDRWAMAFLLEDIGVLAALSGDAPTAFELMGAADALRDAIGTPRAPTLEQELESQLDAAATDLSADERSALRRAAARSTSRPASRWRWSSANGRRRSSDALAGARRGCAPPGPHESSRENAGLMTNGMTIAATCDPQLTHNAGATIARSHSAC